MCGGSRHEPELTRAEAWHPAAVKSSKKKTKTKTKAPKKAAPAKIRKKAAAKKPAPRADYGAPIDAFFGKQSAATRPILEALRELVEAAAPDAESSLKWGMPAYTINNAIMCVLAGHKAHVNRFGWTTGHLCRSRTSTVRGRQERPAPQTDESRRAAAQRRAWLAPRRRSDR